ncbi:MAG: DsbA family oxidoreductase [Pseudomonadota bacterium]
MTVIIEMVSDPVCPWCWLGLRRLNAAVAATPEVDVKLLFRPFELDPSVPAGGVDYKDYMRTKLGGTGADTEDPKTSRFRAMRQALEQYGEDEGVPFAFNGITVRPNTLDAHRLVRWAQGQGKGAEAKEALFSAYFRDHRDIGQADILVAVADEIGIDGAIVKDLLARGADVDEVRKEEAVFRQMGISGVPTYVADRSFALQGAETLENLQALIKRTAGHTPHERPLTG